MFDQDYWKRFMRWEVTWPRKVLSFKDGIVRDEEIQIGTDFDELIQVIEHCCKHQQEITLRLWENQPTDEDVIGEPAMSADESWQAAFNQKQELHK